MQYSRPTLAFKPLILFPPTSYLLPLHPHHHLILLVVSLHLLLPLLLPDCLWVFQWNAGGLRARSTELLHFILSHPVDLICIQESNLNSFSSFRIPEFSTLRSNCTRSGSGIFSTNVFSYTFSFFTHVSGGVNIFVRQSLSFSELFTSFLSSLDPYSDYVGINISLNDSSSVSFLNVYAPLILSSATDSRTDFFSPSILHSYRYLFILGTSIFITPSWTQKVPLTPVGRKYLIGSSLLISSLSMTLIYLLFSIALLAVAPPLTSSSLSALLPYLAPGRCFRTWVLITYEFY